MADTPSRPDDVAVETEPASELRTFLIADVRGYTRFTQEHGDAAAAALVTKFAALMRHRVEAHGGTVIELRGDEALAVFASAREALRAAVELQDRFAAETRADPSLPLSVGIGIDTGEAIPLEGGYRGEALNLAARLCNLAGPGERSAQLCGIGRSPLGLRWCAHINTIAQSRVLCEYQHSSGESVYVLISAHSVADSRPPDVHG